MKSKVMNIDALYLMQATQIRLALAKIYEEEEEWRQSADILCGIPMDSGQK